jgi:hypothetical protein
MGLPPMTVATPSVKTKKKEVHKRYDLPGVINDRSHRTLIAGRAGSGKTQLVLRLLKTVWKGCYSKIYIVSPTFAAQFTSVWSQLDPEGIEVFFEMDDSLIAKLHKNCEANTKCGLDTLILIDDCGDQMRKISTSQFNLFVSNSRHCRASIVHLVQKITQSPTTFRSSCDAILAFGATSYIDREALYKELSTVDRKTFFEMFSKATQERYSFMCSTISKDGRLGFYHSDMKTIVK